MKKRITGKTRLTGEKTRREKLTIGLDLGDRSSRYCVLDEQGDMIQEGSLATTRVGLDRVSETMARCRLALEVGIPHRG
jgi:transposase